MIKTFTGAFEAAGYVLAAPRTQWSAIKPDASAVALTVWSDEITKTREPWVVDVFDHPRLAEWIGRAGNATRSAHIKFGLENCGGRFDLILCRAVDPNVSVRRVDWARPWHERVGVILPHEFRPETGEYRMSLLPRDIAYSSGR
jgi:hypothetical protein